MIFITGRTSRRPRPLISRSGMGGSPDIGVDRITHVAASVGDCGPVWPKTPWRAPPRAARHPAAAGVSAIRILLFSILRADAIACRRATVGTDSHRPWDGRPPTHDGLGPHPHALETPVKNIPD